MIPWLYDDAKTPICALLCKSCYTTEERNGEFTLEMEYPVKSEALQKIRPGRLIKAKCYKTHPDQFFRIQTVSTPIGGCITISANHISYDYLSDVLLNFESADTVQATIAAMADTMYRRPFKMHTDVQLHANAKIKKSGFVTVGEVLKGGSPSVRSIFAAELFFDNYDVYLLERRGRVKQYAIRYMGNLREAKRDWTCAVENAVIPFAKDKKDNLVMISDDWHQNYVTDKEKAPQVQRAVIQDFSESFPEGKGLTPAALKEKVLESIESKRLSELEETFEVNYWDDNAVGGLELCDEVTVLYPAIQFEGSDNEETQLLQKVNKVKYNVIKERNESVEIGNPRPNLQDILNNTMSDLNDKLDDLADKPDSIFTADSSPLQPVPVENNRGNALKNPVPPTSWKTVKPGLYQGWYWIPQSEITPEAESLTTLQIHLPDDYCCISSLDWFRQFVGTDNQKHFVYVNASSLGRRRVDFDLIGDWEELHKVLENKKELDADWWKIQIEVLVAYAPGAPDLPDG